MIFSLVTESFAFRALLGSLAAAGLAALLVRGDVLRGRRARRLLVLAPVLAAAAAGLASIRDAEAYLPQLWLPSEGGQLVELLGEMQAVAAPRGGVLVTTYAAIAGLLLCRRLLGVVAVRVRLRHAAPTDVDCDVAVVARRLAADMDVRAPRLLLLPACPGGAFTTGTLRPVVVVDPLLLDALDSHELEGLVAHELAHVSRRDPLLCLAVGVFRDLTFFLPPLHLAMRWLGREREESADELAACHTGRPVALASGILKVWEASRGRRQGRMACAAVPAVAFRSRGLALPGGGSVTGGDRLIVARVERLIDQPPIGSVLRRFAEWTLAAAILALGTAAALLVPTYLATDLNTYSLSVGYLGAAPAAPVESPAFATFRALALDQPQVDVSGGRSVAPAAPTAASAAVAAPGVETPAQLRRGEMASAAAPSSYLKWGDAGSYSLAPGRGTDDIRGHSWSLPDAEVGFFVLGGRPGR